MTTSTSTSSKPNFSHRLFTYPSSSSTSTTSANNKQQTRIRNDYRKDNHQDDQHTRTTTSLQVEVLEAKKTNRTTIENDVASDKDEFNVVYEGSVTYKVLEKLGKLEDFKIIPAQSQTKISTDEPKEKELKQKKEEDGEQQQQRNNLFTEVKQQPNIINTRRKRNRNYSQVCNNMQDMVSYSFWPTVFPQSPPMKQHGLNRNDHHMPNTNNNTNHKIHHNRTRLVRVVNGLHKGKKGMIVNVIDGFFSVIYNNKTKELFTVNNSWIRPVPISVEHVQTKLITDSTIVGAGPNRSTCTGAILTQPYNYDPPAFDLPSAKSIPSIDPTATTSHIKTDFHNHGGRYNINTTNNRTTKTKQTKENAAKILKAKKEAAMFNKTKQLKATIISTSTTLSVMKKKQNENNDETNNDTIQANET